MVIETDTLRARVGESIRALVQESLKELKETVEKKEQAVLRWADLTVALGITTIPLLSSTYLRSCSSLQTTGNKPKACSTV